MKIEKVEKYDAGYSREDLLKKGSATAAAALLMCGGLASCGYQGGLEYIPNDYDGGQDYVSYSDITDGTSYDDELLLDGDVYYPYTNDSSDEYQSKGALFGKEF